MSEYTIIYLRHKETPLLEFKEHPSYEESQNLSKEDLMKIIHEIDEHNEQVHISYGCELFYLTTTPSRELEVLLWSPEPRVLTIGLIEEILCFYKEEMENCRKIIARDKEDIANLEIRITKANVDLYDKINAQIDECQDSINFEEEELKHYQYLYGKFDFLKDIIDNKSNSENYELIYTKC